MKPIDMPEALRTLGTIYEAAGHEIWLVGGIVRDHVLGLKGKDVDLATSATPEEQVALYEANGYRWVGTGLQHGTITVVAGEETYEITTFRTDVETDGRHAVVAYTRDLAVDLARRDLTMNSIAMSLDGTVMDPFGGIEDAKAGRVRFVGDAAERIREDYLRILRWFRFAGRFVRDIHAEHGDIAAIRENAAGLARISVERVWSEMSRILAGPRPYGVIDLMARAGVLDVLGLPRGDTDRLARMRPITDDPAILLAAWLGGEAAAVAERWKASNAERATAAYVASRLDASYGLAAAKLDLVDGAAPRAVDAVLRARGMNDAVRALDGWEVPAMPVQGRDLLAAGMPPGKAVGERLRTLRDAWIASDYTLGRDELMEAALAPVG